MLDLLAKRLLLPVPENDRDRALVVRVFNSACISITAFLIAAGIGAIFIFVRKESSLAIVLLLSLFLLIALWSAHRGRIRHAGMLLVWGLWSVFTVNIWLSGTVDTVFVGTYIAVITMAAVLIGPRFAVIIAFMSVAAAFGLTLLQSLGYTWSSYYPMPPWAALFVLLFTIVMIVPAIHGMVRAFSEASRQASQELETRRKTEEILRESEVRYRSLFEQSGNAVAVYKAVNDGEDFIFVDFNKAGEQIEQVSRERLIGQSVTMMFPGVKEGGLFDVFQRVWRTGNAERHPVTLYRDERIEGWRDNFVHKLATGEIVAVYSDETERKKAEQALRQSQAMLSLALEGANLGIWEWDLTTGKALWSERTHRQLGYEPNEFEPNLKNWKRLIHTDDWPRVSENLNLHIQGKLPTFEMEYRIRNKSGNWQWVQAQGKVVECDQDGKPIRMAGVVADITERKKAEEALRNSEAKYRFLAEHGSDLIWTLDMNLRTTFVTPSVEKVLGFTPEERTLQRVEDQLTPESLEFARQRLFEELSIEREQGIQEGKSELVELDYYHKNGSVVCLQTAVAFIRDENGTPIGLHGISRDVTELKRTQEALRESEEKYRTVVEEAFDGVFVHNGTVITFANARLHEMLGYEPGGLNGLNHWLIYDLDFQDLKRSRAQARVRGESVIPRYEVNLLRKDGTSFPAEVKAKVILFDMEPQIQVWIRDLTEQKRLEKELVQAQKMEAIGTLTGGIAHDFNNLLTVVNGYTEMILLETAEDDPRYEDLKKIFETGRKGAEMVQRLLTFSRKTEMNPQPLNLNCTVENSVALIKRTFPKVIEIETILEKDLRKVNADSGQVEQVLMNLCINAKEAMPRGGKLTIATKNANVEEEACGLQLSAKPAPHVVIEITDTGTGMDATTLDRLFDPFFTTKGWDFRKGTGLSLPVAKGIVEQHGGWIACESEQGKGTTFRLYFPAIQDSPAIRKPESRAESLQPGQKILLVDDEDLVRELGKRMLERSGHSVITACNGKEALEIYATEKSDIALIVLDLIMPQMGGEQCLDQLVKINPHVKVIVSTGHSLAQEERDRLGALAKGFVNKPYRIAEFLKVVTHVLETT